MVIGKGGSNVDALRAQLNKLTGKQVHINIVEIKNLIWTLTLLVKLLLVNLSNVLLSVVHKTSYPTCKCVLELKGIKTQVSGRLNGADIARAEGYSEGTVPLHTLRADIDYALGRS